MLCGAGHGVEGVGGEPLLGVRSLAAGNAVAGAVGGPWSVGAGAVVGMWRSRAFRLAAGGVAGLSACAVAAIKDRLDFFQRTQREQAEKELQQLA